MWQASDSDAAGMWAVACGFTNEFVVPLEMVH